MFSINRPNCSYSCFLEVTIWSSIWQNVDRHKNCWCKYGYQGKFWEKASFNIYLKTTNFINKADAEVRFTLMKLNSVFQSTFEQFGADTYSSISKVMSSVVSSQSFKQSLTENESLTYIVWATLIETSLSLSRQTLSELIVRTSWITIKTIHEYHHQYYYFQDIIWKINDAAFFLVASIRSVFIMYSAS